MKRGSRPGACALAAVLAVAALEPVARWAARHGPPSTLTPAFAKVVWRNDRLARWCAERQGVVLFTGGSPTGGLDRGLLQKELEPLGGSPCVIPFAGGLRPPELHAYLPEILALRPRALVLHLGHLTFGTYDATIASRLSYFSAERLFPFLGLRQVWAMRAVLVRSAAARLLVAFRYRHAVRAALWPRGYPYSQERGNTVDMNEPRPVGFSLSPGMQLWMLDDFLSVWRGTNIPLVVWDSPRETTGRVPGRPLPAREIASYVRLAKAALARADVAFVGPDQAPRLGPEHFADPVHLNAEGGTLMTRALLPYVKAALGAQPGPAPRTELAVQPHEPR